MTTVKCARCGTQTAPLHEDGTCWPCAIAYRDEIIEELRAEAALAANPVIQPSDDAAVVDIDALVVAISGAVSTVARTHGVSPVEFFDAINRARREAEA